MASKLPVLVLLALPATVFAKPAWEQKFTKQPVAVADAEAYCTSLGEGWRLPVRAELESLGIDDSGRAAKGAPKLPAQGFLWSGEDVSADRVGQRWIMNLANGHLFNGDGYEGYAKCVKGPKPSIVEHALPPGYLYIGPADATLTIVAAAQLDSMWHGKGRPLVEKMLAAHPVRFEIHAFTISDKYLPISLAACAAGRQQKFTAFEALLASNKVGMSTSAAELRKLAIEAGANGKAYDSALPKCRELAAADAKAFARKVEGAPTFFVGNRKITGAVPDQLDAAIKAALSGT